MGKEEMFHKPLHAKRKCESLEGLSQLESDFKFIY